MNRKQQLIDYIKQTYKADINTKNTCFSSINKTKAVWWLNIPVSKFEQQMNLLLDSDSTTIWIVLPKKFVNNLANTFKIREDINALDLEISSNKKIKYMIDIKSNGTEFDFSQFIKEEFEF